MDVILQKNMFKAKVFLVFFCFVILFNCKQVKNIDNELINYENDKAVSISFSSNVKTDELKITLKGNNTAILGDFYSNKGIVTFRPVIPFTSGKEYELKDQDATLITFKIEDLISTKAELLGIYPTKDTVPENLLKMYFVFSKPMQEVKSALEYITVIDNTKKEEVPVFLELQTELWNKDHTQLTLWLDPGRIKTDLIPNKELGLPIVNGNTYTIRVSKDFKDANGNLLNENFHKTFLVREKDSKSPDINKWLIKTPLANTQNELIIDFGESLDFALALETVKVLDSINELVPGDFKLTNNESVLKFQPKSNWKNGNYSISVNTELEDLAGNNLNYLFDRDLNEETIKTEYPKFKSIQFEIK
ncbi:Ig-like domain-containing protein [Yeosuana sp. MJ-SS3]|uniref:Ig-like domain-containing protein n=1 Tax=Gilvirhabdus luticola TaxID=3079858 RepID=A0ABU3U9K9_9FLAO|nr:Ig-like domain-containing protein [Yeosuana sp. MJ-SS3]MDU8887093.1 Ig-like domain-containing protein [Yeosuana sp. MJ-SS3]